jgi:hypothetical protein
MRNFILWLLVAYFWIMFVVFGVVLFEVNCLHYNPIGINEDFGAQFLLGYMMFMVAVAICAILNTISSNNNWHIVDKNGHHYKGYSQVLRIQKNWEVQFKIYPWLKEHLMSQPNPHNTPEAELLY